MSTIFRFALGAAVVLATSAPLVMDALEMEAEEAALPKQDEGDDLVLGRMVFGAVEEGVVIGRTEFLKGEESTEGDYLVRYRDGSGRQVERWHSGDALTTREAIEAEFAREQEAAVRQEEEASRPTGGFEEDRPHAGSDVIQGSNFGEDGERSGRSVLNA
jgi:hypothetical protein